MIVVLVVVGVLLCLIVVGLTSARESARKAQCAGNLKQLGLAIHSYHRAQGVLPPTAYRGNVAINLTNTASTGTEYSLGTFYANWGILLLPYLGEGELAASFEPRAAITDPANAKIRATQCSVMNCPSDTFNCSDNPFCAMLADGRECRFARGNYGINMGVSGLRPWPGLPCQPQPGGYFTEPSPPPHEELTQIWTSGIAGFNKAFSFKDFDNGLSNLVGIDELRAGLIPEDARGVWALGEIGASATCGHGLIGDATGPNCKRSRADDTVGCNQAREVFGEAGLVHQGMPCCWYEVRSAQATARSMHPGGVHVLMLDGSTRFVMDSVDQNVWHVIHSRESRDLQIPERCDQSVSTNASPPPPIHPEHPLPTHVKSIQNSIGMIFVQLLPGEFIMGLPDAGTNPATGAPPDAPAHEVQITKGFYLSAFEVTQAQYAAIVGKSPSFHSAQGEGKDRLEDSDTRDFPVEQVSWADAVAFCQCLSSAPAEVAAGRRYRLPTEAEWEYACRSGSRHQFERWKDDEVAREIGFNMYPDKTNGLPVKSVGCYPPNEFGLYDMRGNVFEWCADWFAWDYYKQSPRNDPQGPASGVLRVVRGADWRFTGMGCKYTRFDTEPWRRNPYIGFRVVCELKSQ
jgi:prepilin-type processing-associated H-X9-DG protein